MEYSIQYLCMLNIFTLTTTVKSTEIPVFCALCYLYELLFQIGYYIWGSIFVSMLARTHPQRDRSACSNKWFLHLNNRFPLRGLEDGMKTKLSEKNESVLVPRWRDRVKWQVHLQKREERRSREDIMIN